MRVGNAFNCLVWVRLMIVYAKFTVTKEWLDRDCFNVDIPNLFNAQWSGLERSKESVNVYIDIFAYRL